MRDRWDEDEEELGRGRSRGREPEPEREPTVGELIDNSVRRLVTGLVIAGGLIALGTWSGGRGGGSAAPGYQITTSADGRTVYRVNTDSGSIVACRDNHCWLMQRGSHDLDDGPPAENVAAPPAAQVAPQQPAAPIAPAPPTPQLPAPQNNTAPATR
jgi:hypothetical protein